MHFAKYKISFGLKKGLCMYLIQLTNWITLGQFKGIQSIALNLSKKIRFVQEIFQNFGIIFVYQIPFE